MREIGSFDAKARLGQLLDSVEAGENVIITRRNRAVARQTSPVLDIKGENYVVSARASMRSIRTTPKW